MSVWQTSKMDIEIDVGLSALYSSLGKTLVRVQALELLLKRLLASRSFGGTVEDIETWMSKRHADYATNTLGTLVNELLASYLVSDSYVAEEAPDPPTDTHIYFRFESVVTMESERLLEMRTLFKGLVATRNDIVHHLAELFPLKTLDGCREASAFLANFESNLRRAGEELKGWAETHDKAVRLHAEVLKSPEFNNYLLDGILPDGTVHWEISGIVRALRDAANSQPAGSWVSLEDAIAWIRRQAPLQIPSRYGCATYRQAIHKSQAFEVKREARTDYSTVLLYRSK